MASRKKSKKKKRARSLRSHDIPSRADEEVGSIFTPETSRRLRNAADAVLGAIETNPEMAFTKLEAIGNQIERTAAYYREHPEEAKKAVKFTALAGLAKAIRRGLRDD